MRLYEHAFCLALVAELSNGLNEGYSLAIELPESFTLIDHKNYFYRAYVKSQGILGKMFNKVYNSESKA